MSSNILKLIACVAMLCDHMGYTMQYYHVGSYDAAELLRLIGRIAFPIFAFLIAEGFKKTHNVLLYAIRLIIAGFISEIPFDLCFHDSLKYSSSFNNVMFSLSTALLALIFADMCIKSSKKELRILFVVPVLAACYMAKTLSMDYGYWGIILIFLFYLVDSDSVKKKLMLVPVVLLFAARHVITTSLPGGTPGEWAKLQLLSLFSLIPILLYNGKKGRSSASGVTKKIRQYAFYLFYPAHMLALYFIFSNMNKIISFLGL